MHDDISGKSVCGSFILNRILVNILKQNSKPETGIKLVDNLDGTHALAFGGYTCVWWRADAPDHGAGSVTNTSS